MYVIFPAEEVIDLTYGIGPNGSSGSGSAALGARLRQPSPAPCADAHTHAHAQAHAAYPLALGPHVHAHALALAQRNAAQQHLAALAGGGVGGGSASVAAAAAAPGGGGGGGGGGGAAGAGRKTKGKKSALKGGDQAAAAAGAAAMAAGGEVALRELVHPALNEALKQHNAVSFKLVRTVSDFTQQLSQVYEQHAEELQLLVANFRKRNAELRKERPACPSALFHTWETLLQEVEVDSQAHSDIASVLGRQVSRPLLERSFHRKIQSRKVFTHRESYETILTKTEDKLVKCRQDYKTAYLSYLGSPSTVTLSAYLDAHNEYVAQLHATNGMLERYHQEALPQLLQELEDVYSDANENPHF